MDSAILHTSIELINETGWNTLLDGTFLLLLAGVAVYAKTIPQGNRRWWELAATLGALVLMGQFAGQEVLRVLLLDAAAFVAVAMVWTKNTPQAIGAAKTYLQLLLVAVVCLGLGLYLAGEGELPPAFPVNNIAVALLIIGFGLKLALVPFYFWLPNVATYAAPMTTALIVAVVDISAFSELAHLRLIAPWVFTDHQTLWLVIALLTMFGGAIMALSQQNIKRMLAFSTIDDMGYLLLGVLAGTTIGISGALLAALNHALQKVILFGAVGIAEHKRGHDITLKDRGLASLYPISAAAFIVGSLGMIGVPPLFGFAGRWRIYLSGAELGGLPLVLAMAAATGLALLYYARAIHRVWLGDPAKTDSAPAGEPTLAVAVLGLLMIISLVLGLFPSLITGLIL